MRNIKDTEIGVAIIAEIKLEISVPARAGSKPYDWEGGSHTTPRIRLTP